MAKKLMSDKELAEVKDFIRVGKEFSEKEFAPKVGDYRDFYSCKHYKTSQTNEDRIAVPEIFATVRTILPSVFNQSPRFLVLPASEADVAPASMAQLVVNYQWDRFRVQEQVELALIDFLLLGWGVVKVAWYTETGTTVSQEPRQVLGIQMGTRTKKEMTTIYDAPYVEWVDPTKIYVSPDATTLCDTAFVIQEIVLPFKKVKDNPLYANTSDLQPSMVPERPDQKGYVDELNSDKAHLQKAIIYECYLRDSREVVTLAKDHDKPLRRVDFPYEYRYGHPFEDIRNYVIPGKFYPFGEAKTIHSQQLELDKTRSQQINQRKRFSRLVYIDPDAQIEDDTRTAVESGQDGTIVDCKKDQIGAIEWGNASPDIKEMDAIIKEDIRRITGVSDYQRSALPEGTQTATEANLLGQAAMARPKEKARKVEAFCANIAEKLITLSRQYYKEEQVVRITDDPTSAQQFLPFTGDTLIGEYDFHVEVGSSQPKNQELLKQQALELYERFTGLNFVNQRELVKIVLEAYELHKNEAILYPEGQEPKPKPPEAKPVFTFDSGDFSPSMLIQILEQLGYKVVQTPGELTNEQEGQLVSAMAKPAPTPLGEEGEEDALRQSTGVRR